MSRKKNILEGITKEMRGIEIAPWHSPLTPKREGFNCLSLDVFPTTELLHRARADESISSENIEQIESVDLVGNATDIAEIVPAHLHGTFDYVVSSHNFEHLPNPIKFLQGCEKVLKKDGVLVMAIPDVRACFDFYRPRTTLIEWLTAFKLQYSKPTAEQVFQTAAFFSVLSKNGGEATSFTIQDSTSDIVMKGSLQTSYEKWLSSEDSSQYVDAHCSVMTPASFELLITECQYLGLISMNIGSIRGPHGNEFYVSLHNSCVQNITSDINATRTILNQKMLRERFPAPLSTSKLKLRKKVTRFIRHYIKAAISIR